MIMSEGVGGTIQITLQITLMDSDTVTILIIIITNNNSNNNNSFWI